MSLEYWARLVSAVSPRWAAGVVSLSAKYLGIYIGNEHLGKIWQAPMKKFGVRVGQISALAGAWNSQATSYRVCAVSVLTYVMQYAVLSNDIKHNESAYIAKVLKVPRNAITNEVAHHLQLLRLPLFHHFNIYRQLPWREHGCPSKYQLQQQL